MDKTQLYCHALTRAFRQHARDKDGLVKNLIDNLGEQGAKDALAAMQNDESLKNLIAKVANTVHDSYEIQVPTVNPDDVWDTGWIFEEHLNSLQARK